jgi:hypothetical protein
LDYALVADYARVEGGKLTIVGASYTHVRTPTIPGAHLLAVAGRVRSGAQANPVALRITVQSPGNEYTLSMDASLAPDDTTRPYDGKVGLLFAATITIPLPSEGLYEVFIDLDSQRVRRLAFDVSRFPDR